MRIKKPALITSSLIKKAVYFSAEKHDKQYRKGLRVPYFAHPVLVALGVLEYSHDENLIAAAILHDILEDCRGVTTKELEKLFGEKVSKIVLEVTFLKGKYIKNMSWKNRKQFYINKIQKDSKEALLILASDKITNMKGYFEFAESNSQKELSKLFHASLQDYFWYYKKILTILKSRLHNHQIVKEYENLIQHYELKLMLEKN